MHMTDGMEAATDVMRLRALSGSKLLSGSAKKVGHAAPLQRGVGQRKKSMPGSLSTICKVAVKEQSMPSVQRLHDACKAAFSGEVPPTSQALQRVQIILDQIKPADVGLDDLEGIEVGLGNVALGKNGRHGRRTGRAPPITYLELYECDDFSMGIFCLPSYAALPLHNHPGMTVLSKVLYGSMHVRSFDWVNPPAMRQNGAATQPRQGVLVDDHVLTAPCPTEVLFPSSGGNIHAFTAVTPCAVLDVLAPPYDVTKGRHCTYYREVQADGLGEGAPLKPQRAEEQCGNGTARSPGMAWLIEYPPPDDFVVQRGVYRGPKISA